jgi:signal transduction histidine kinase
VTAHKVAEAALAGVGRKMIEANEMERSRIARDLHDDIGQRMAVLIMELDGASEALPLNLTEWRERLRTLSGAALALSKDIQAISHRLHSSKLDFLGLVSASESLCRELAASRPGLRVDFDADDVPREVPPDVALAVFRVLQEAVNNAAKHAEARRLQVTLEGVADWIHLEVVDDGIGFDPEAAMNGAGMGLVSMRERLTLVAGELFVESRPGAGSTIRARAPIRPDVRLKRSG